MREKRFVIENIEFHEGREVVLSVEQSMHLSKVLRLKEGNKIIVTSGAGEVYRALIRHHDSGGRASIVLLEKLHEHRESAAIITAACAFPKNSVIDTLIPKLVQLGVNNIVFFQSERSVVKIQDIEHKCSRLERIAMESLKQCQRTTAPEITVYKDIHSFINKHCTGSHCSPDLKRIILSTEGGCELLSVVLDEMKDEQGNEYVLLFGPEGGFSEEEISFSCGAGFVPASLGSRILTVETAVISAISVFLSHIGEM